MWQNTCEYDILSLVAFPYFHTTPFNPGILLFVALGKPVRHLSLRLHPRPCFCSSFSSTAGGCGHKNRRMGKKNNDTLNQLYPGNLKWWIGESMNIHWIWYIKWRNIYMLCYCIPDNVIDVQTFGSLPFNLVFWCCFHVIKGSTCKTPSSEDQVPNPTWIRSTRIHRGPDVTDIHPQVPSARTHGASPHRAASMPSNHGKQKWKRPKVIYNGFSIMHTLNLARFKRTVCLNLKKQI